MNTTLRDIHTYTPNNNLRVKKYRAVGISGGDDITRVKLTTWLIYIYIIHIHTIMCVQYTHYTYYILYMYALMHCTMTLLGYKEKLLLHLTSVDQ